MINYRDQEDVFFITNGQCVEMNRMIAYDILDIQIM